MDSTRLTSFNHDTGAWKQRMRGVVPLCTLVGLSLILLISCASPASTKGTTQQTPTTPGGRTPTPQLTLQYDFTEQDSGRTVTYTVTSRFEIALNSQKYPKNDIQVSCSPQDTIGSVSNLPYVAPPLYVVRYEGVTSGICTIKNGTFRLMVRIIDLTQ